MIWESYQLKQPDEIDYHQKIFKREGVKGEIKFNPRGEEESPIGRS